MRSKTFIFIFCSTLIIIIGGQLACDFASKMCNGDSIEMELKKDNDNSSENEEKEEKRLQSNLDLFIRSVGEHLESNFVLSSTQIMKTSLVLNVPTPPPR